MSENPQGKADGIGDPDKIVAEFMLSVQALEEAGSVGEILEFAIDSLTNALKADRGIVWLISKGKLSVGHYYSLSGDEIYEGIEIPAKESASIVVDFGCRVPSNSCVVTVAQATEGQGCLSSPSMKALNELADVKSHMVARMSGNEGNFGFLEIQQCADTRDWSRSDAMILQRASEILFQVLARGRTC